MIVTFCFVDQLVSRFSAKCKYFSVSEKFCKRENRVRLERVWEGV